MEIIFSRTSSRLRLTAIIVGLFFVINMVNIWEMISGVNPNTNYLTQQAVDTLSLPSFSNYGTATQQAVTQPLPGSPTSTNQTSPSAWIPSSTGSIPTGDVKGASTENNTPSYDPYAQLRGDISSGWDQYLASLDQQLGPLGEQQNLLTSNIGSQKASSMADLDLQKTQGVQQLNQERETVQTNQAKNLRDLAGNITNAMRAGSIYLGARGAGDSSAANMYSYALAKEGSRQRSDVMQNTAQIQKELGAREENLVNIYNTEKNKLESWANEQVNSVAMWYQQAVQQIQQQKAQGQLGKSQDLQNLAKDILNQGMAMLGKIQDYAINKRTALDQWALSNSENLAQVKANMQGVAGYKPDLPQIPGGLGTPQTSGNGNIFTPAGYGYSSEEEKRL